MEDRETKAKEVSSISKLVNVTNHHICFISQVEIESILSLNPHLILAQSVSETPSVTVTKLPSVSLYEFQLQTIPDHLSSLAGQECMLDLLFLAQVS
jgi:hypothetical protein